MTVLLMAAASAAGGLDARTAVVVAPSALVDLVARAPSGLLTELRAEIRTIDGTLVAAAIAPFLETPVGGDLSDYTARLIAPSTLGEYVAVWTDPDGETADEPLVVKGWRPTRPDIAALVRSRNRNGSGNVQQTWNATTQPTGDEVERYITMAVGKVDGIMGSTDDVSVLTQAHSLASMLSALDVERSSDNPRDVLIRSWERSIDRDWKHLERAVAEVGAGGDPSASDDQLMPLYSFPSAVGLDSVEGAERPVYR